MDMALRSATAVLGFLLLGFTPDLRAASIPSARPPKLGSAAYIVQDQRTGEFLLSRQAEIAMPIASITKLVTAMVLLDAHLDMEETIVIQEADKDTLRNSPSHLAVGTRLRRREALLVALMASENRAAHALARTYPGGVRALVQAMNEKALAIGLKYTKFEDPTGLSDGNISTAQELSRLVDAACRYPLICQFSTRREATIRIGRRQLKYVNTNSLVRSPRWQIGLSKTGYIEEGGRCLVMQTLLAKRPVLIVLLNSAGKNTRIGDANRIKKWMEASATPRKAKKPKSRRT